MLRLAGKEGDGVVLNWLSPDDTARVVPLVLDGNPAADVVARLFAVTGPDREAARGLARRMVTAYLNTGVYAEYQRWLGRARPWKPCGTPGRRVTAGARRARARSAEHPEAVGGAGPAVIHDPPSARACVRQ
jgi:alkanesulfonate monooxygenase SsuD/methylene tetrahydromethanopterin reductase-like flavin-dependent oxidoreductase (luciferase family)